MLDFGWSEIAVIAVVALVVIGPKDLPKVLRTVGQWTSKARSMAREFQSSMEDMARDADLAELRKDMAKVTALDPKAELSAVADPDGQIRNEIEEVARIDLRKELEAGYHPPAEGEQASPAADAAAGGLAAEPRLLDDAASAAPPTAPKQGSAS